MNPGINILIFISSCMTGPCEHPEPCCFGRCLTTPACFRECEPGDLDGDCDVDLRDYALFQNAYVGEE